MSDTKLRMNINTTAIVKAAEIISNTVLLTANAYLIGSNLRNHFHQTKQERISSSLQTSAEIASAAAGLTKIIAETIGMHNANGNFFTGFGLKTF